MRKFVSSTGTLELSRTVRRTLVVLMYGVYFGLIAYRTYLPGDMPIGRLTAAPWLTLVGLVTFVGSYLVLNISTQKLADRFKKTLTGQPLDERQLLLRNQAFFWAYLLLGVVAFVLLMDSDERGFGWTLIALAGLYMSLPAALIAWLEPDPVEDELTTNNKRVGT